MVIEGTLIKVDITGTGHRWRPAAEDNCPVNVRQEIAAKIVSGQTESSDFVASNGMHYSWSKRA